MKTLHRAVKRQGVVGEPLPSVFDSFADARILFRKAGFSMVAGLPGNYKSTLVYNLICKWARRRYPPTEEFPEGEPIVILYIAADSDEHQVASLCAAMISGDPAEVTEKGIRNGEYAEELASIASIEWEFRPLGISQIAERMAAMNQRWGKRPDIVIVDNLMNCVAGPGDWSGQLEMVRDLKQLATDSLCHVMVLHHTQEHPMKTSQIGYPPPRWDIHGKVSQFPTLILTVATAISREEDRGVLRVAPVKNRTGPDDMAGGLYIEYNIRPSNGRVWEVQERV
jgi:KaiC/GvpD/RAD55 family RecA-like ATPase